MQANIDRAVQLFNKAKDLQPTGQFHTVYEALRLAHGYQKSLGAVSEEFARAWATLKITRRVLLETEDKLTNAVNLLHEATKCAQEANQHAFITARLLGRVRHGETSRADIDALRTSNDDAVRNSLARSDALRDASYAKAAANTEYARQLAMAMACLDKCIRAVAARP